MIETLKEPVHIDADVDRRVMQAISELPVSRPHSWLTPRWTVRVSPIGALAAAAAVAGLVLAAHLFTRAQPAAIVAQADTIAVAPARVAMQFVLVAPQAKAVS